MEQFRNNALRSSCPRGTAGFYRSDPSARRSQEGAKYGRPPLGGGRYSRGQTPRLLQVADGRLERAIHVPQWFEGDVNHMAVRLIVEHLVAPEGFGILHFDQCVPAPS